MTPNLKTMRADYITALGESDVDVRILNYVNALTQQLNEEKERVYNLRCHLEDAQNTIYDMWERQNADV